MRRLALGAAIGGLVLAAIFGVMVLRPAPVRTTTPPPLPTSGPDLVSPGLDDGSIPWSIADLVSEAEVIVVARQGDLTDAGTLVMMTPEPTPTDGGDYAIQPTIAFNEVNTSMVVDQILKSDGRLEVGQTIHWRDLGTMPVTPAEVQEDAASSFPLKWPVGTEFVVFLRRNPDTGGYFVSGGADGRVLTAGDQVTSSDAARTVRAYMRGMDRPFFIHAITSQVAVNALPKAPVLPVSPEQQPVGADEPRLALEGLSAEYNDTYIMGDVPADRITERSLTLRNVGRGTLVIESLASSCGCMTLTTEQQELAPGEATALHLAYDPRVSRDFGKYTQRPVRIRSNDPLVPLVEIRVSAEVAAE